MYQTPELDAAISVMGVDQNVVLSRNLFAREGSPNVSELTYSVSCIKFLLIHVKYNNVRPVVREHSQALWQSLLSQDHNISLLLLNRDMRTVPKTMSSYDTERRAVIKHAKYMHYLQQIWN